jgi:quercetin dioxygenase-like cupin family protein
VYVTEGVFILRLQGRDPVSIGPGEVFVEPPHVNMTRSNDGAVPTTTILFYVCEPDAPFADPAQTDV